MMLFSNFARAEFVFDKDYCFLSSDFSFQYEEENVLGIFQIAFSQLPVTLPVMNISFSGDFKPEQLSIGWNNPQVNDRNNNPIFDSKFTAVLNSSDKKFPFYRNGGEVYYSPAYGFLSSQVFLSMFLSQIDMDMTYQMSGQDEQIIKIPLTGSDMTLRQMLVDCYPEKSSEYLNIHFTRRKNLSESWKNGYGMVAYQFADNILEGNYYLNENKKTNVPLSYEFYSELHPLLQRKSELLTEINQAEAESESASLLLSIKDLVAEINFKSQRVLELGTENQEGLIIKTEALIADLKERKQDLERQIYRLSTDEIKPQEEVVEETLDRNSVLIQELEAYDTQLSEIDTRIIKADQNLEQLQQAYEYVVTKISSSELEIVQEQMYAGPPLVYEEIESRMQNVANLEMDLISLRQLSENILSLEGELKKSVNFFRSAMQSYEEFIELQRKLTLIDYQIQSSQIEKRKLIDEVGLEITDLRHFNEITEQERPSTRSVDEEKTSIIEQLRQANARYDDLKDDLASENLVILSKILCGSDIFRVDVNDYCLTPLEVSHEAEAIRYFEGMDSMMIDDIIVSSQIDYFYPWKNSENKSKVDVLVEALNVEKQNQELYVKSQEGWKTILTLRWKYNLIRNLKDIDVSTQTYEQGSLDLRRRLDDLDRLVSENIKEKNDLLNNSQVLQSNYVQDEKIYNDAVQVFSNALENMMIAEEQDSAQISSCSLTRLDVLNCEAQYESYVENLTSVISQKQQEFNLEVKNFTWGILAEIQSNSLQKTQSLDEQTTITAQRHDFLQRTELERLLAEQQALQAEYDKLLQQQSTLEGEKDNITNSMENKVIELAAFEEERKTLNHEIQELRTQVSGLSDKVSGYCAHQEHLYAEVKEIDHRIVDLGGVIASQAQIASPCLELTQMSLR